MKQSFPSWGFQPLVELQKAVVLTRSSIPPIDGAILPRGLGRSYGDSCLNDGGTLLLTKELSYFISFDEKTGILECEAGVTLDDILKVFVPKGWFLPVTPGTKFVTIGGAIANDVHGKNHHKAGNFGHHVLSIEVIRTDRDAISCSREENSELFYATIGGLGLTGLISKVRIKLIPITSAYIDQEQIKFNSLAEFMRISSESEDGFDYTVAWVDCVSGNELRGIFIRGNHSSGGDLLPHKEPKLKVPFTFPNWILNPFTVRMFNYLYFFKNTQKVSKSHVHYEGFFYPLDAIYNWNRIYGKRGFYQYQFVVPLDEKGESALREILTKIKNSGYASFLVVLKTFGDIPSLGMLSFPKKGITLALDFANYGEPLLGLLQECDIILESVGGRIYPAKDARMSSDFFHKTYNCDRFKNFIDKKFSSSFSRRVKL